MTKEEKTKHVQFALQIREMLDEKIESKKEASKATAVFEMLMKSIDEDIVYLKSLKVKEGKQ